MMEIFDHQPRSDNRPFSRLAGFPLGYRYSEILRSLMCVYLLRTHLSAHPHLCTCSADTLLRSFSGLSSDNVMYVSATGNSYEFNTAERPNELLVKALVETGRLVPGREYDIDFEFVLARDCRDGRKA